MNTKPHDVTSSAMHGPRLNYKRQYYTDDMTDCGETWYERHVT